MTKEIHIPVVPDLLLQEETNMEIQTQIEILSIGRSLLWLLALRLVLEGRATIVHLHLDLHKATMPPLLHHLPTNLLRSLRLLVLEVLVLAPLAILFLLQALCVVVPL